LDMGITAYVAKPIQLLELGNALLAAMESLAHQSAEAATTTQHEILLAEDNLVNQKLAKRFLEQAGHIVDIVENGALAVEAVQRRDDADRPFDLILMDISMPRMGGIEATTIIRKYEEEHRRRHTPIIALTAHAMIGDRERILQAGMDEYIAKPLNKNHLLLTITRVIRESQRM